MGISVVIPTFNGAACIGAALASVVEQQRRPTEIIVVDDCSTDATLEIVRQFQASSPIPIQCLCLDANSGSPARPINRGIDAAREPLIAILEQDDVFLPAKLSEQAAALEGNNDLTLVFGLCQRLGAPDQPGSRSQGQRALRALRSAAQSVVGCDKIDGEAFLRLLVLHGSVFSGFPGFMFRRSAWQQKGGISERWQIAADLDLVCWLAARGPVGWIARPHYARNLQRGTLSADGARAHADLLEVFAEHLGGVRSCLAEPSVRAALRHYVAIASWYLALQGSLAASLSAWRGAQPLGMSARHAVDLAPLPGLRLAGALGGKHISSSAAHSTAARVQRAAAGLAAQAKHPVAAASSDELSAARVEP